MLNNKVLIFTIIIFAISIFAFLPSLKNDFVWDDEEVIEKTHYLYKASSIKNTIIPKQTENKRYRYYRPVHYASIVLDKYIWGVNSFGFHLTNIILHAINSVLVFLLFRQVLTVFKFKEPDITSFFGAVLFVLHPIHTESVSWIAGRTDMLCTLFFLASLNLHLKLNYNRALIPFVLLTYYLSLLSKEIALAFPLVVFSLDYLTKNIKRSRVFLYTGYVLISIIYLYLRGRAYINVPDIMLSEAVSTYNSSFTIFIQSLKILINSYFFYIYKLLFPIDLNAFIASVPDEFFYTCFSVLTLLAVSAMVFYFGSKKQRVLPFGFLLFVLTLAPSATVALSNIAATPLAERYLYLPSVGFILMLTYMIFTLQKRIKTNTVYIIFTALAAVYLILCINRQSVWKNSLSLWKDTSQKSYLSPIVHTNYGTALLDNGHTQKAIEEFKIALSPKLGDSNRGKALSSINLGNAYINLKQYSMAEKWFIKANQYDPTYGRTYYHLGLINFIKGELYSSQKHYKTSEQYLLKTFDFYHSYSKAHLLLSNVYTALGDKEKAKKHAAQALKIGLPENLSEQAEDIIKVND